MPTPIRRPDDDPPGAWRRNPYVLMLIAIPLSVVVMASVMIPLSIQSHDGNVIDDYYKRGLLIDRELARDEAAKRLGLSATAVLEPQPPSAVVTLDAAAVEAPAQLTLRLMHATRGDTDTVAIAARGADGRYRAPLKALVPGRWYARIEHPDWRLSGEFHYPHSLRLELN